MPPRRKVLRLPAAVKKWLDERLIEGNFSGYEALSAELASRGYGISKSALHDYGQDFEEQLAALKLGAEQAQALVASSPDDEGAISDALMRLMQNRLFGILVKAENDKLSVGDLAKLTHAISVISRASITLKRYTNEVRKQREAAAKDVARIAKAGGLSMERVDEIKAKILGIGQ